MVGIYKALERRVVPDWLHNKMAVQQQIYHLLSSVDPDEEPVR